MNRKLQNKLHGFSLVELIITVAIIGIISAIAIPRYRLFTAKAKRVQAISDLRAVAAMLEARAEEGSLDPEEISKTLGSHRFTIPNFGSNGGSSDYGEIHPVKSDDYIIAFESFSFDMSTGTTTRFRYNLTAYSNKTFCGIKDRLVLSASDPTVKIQTDALTSCLEF